MDKVCKIINGQFSWRLEVDGQAINFNGGHNAEYFAEHYESLGYTIERYGEGVSSGCCASYENHDCEWYINHIK